MRAVAQTRSPHIQINRIRIVGALTLNYMVLCIFIFIKAETRVDTEGRSSLNCIKFQPYYDYRSFGRFGY